MSHIFIICDTPGVKKSVGQIFRNEDVHIVMKRYLLSFKKCIACVRNGNDICVFIKGCSHVFCVNVTIALYQSKCATLMT